MNEIAFLIVWFLSSTGGTFYSYYHEMPNMKICQECLETAKIDLPQNGDAEAVVVMYCAKDKPKRK